MEAWWTDSRDATTLTGSLLFDYSALFAAGFGGPILVGKMHTPEHETLSYLCARDEPTR